MRRGLGVAAFGLAAWALVAITAPEPCAARSRGIAVQGCGGCHVEGVEPEVRLSTLGQAVPGQPLTLVLEIEAVNGPTAGFYMAADVPGTLQPIAGQGTQAFGGGIAHASPKQGSELVRFEVSWLAPAEPTGVQFQVWAVSANDNNRSTGDGAGATTFSLVSGCDGELYFRDADRDGYGSSTFGMRVDCAEREGYTKVEGDCDENNAEVNPGADEYCNERDDDCDDQIDEGSLPQPHYPDRDGDGHGEPGGEPVLECPPPDGYAPSNDDCLEGVATAHPGADEICDGYDNDCDNEADERVKPTCGVGWCRRESWSCRAEDCTPGEPRAEECNAFDDDCDDALDEGVDCGAGLSCIDGECTAATAAPDAGEPTEVPAGPAPDAASPGHADAAAASPTPNDGAGGCSIARAHAPRWPGLAAILAIAAWLAGQRKRRIRDRRARARSPARP